MTIKNEDLQLLVRIENFLGTNFPRGSEGYWSTNHCLITLTEKDVF